MSVQEPVMYKATCHFGAGMIAVRDSWKSKAASSIGEDENADVKQLPVRGRMRYRRRRCMMYRFLAQPSIQHPVLGQFDQRR